MCSSSVLGAGARAVGPPATHVHPILQPPQVTPPRSDTNHSARAATFAPPAAHSTMVDSLSRHHPSPRTPRRIHAPFAAVLAPLATFSTLLVAVPAQAPAAAKAAPNPYNLTPFHADFPSALEYPPMHGLEYARTRRQVLQQLASNLQGNVQRDAWLLATDFYWRAPEDAIDPLIEAMDRGMNSQVADVVRNCVEAMGRMGDPAFDAALRRALMHKHPAVRDAAYTALGRCGNEETLLELKADFTQMGGNARKAWLRGVAERLPEKRVEVLGEIMAADYPPAVRDELLQQLPLLPVEEAAAVLQTRWFDAVDQFKAVIAGAMHAAGDGRGTAWLQEALQSEDLDTLRHAIRHCAYGKNPGESLGELRELLLRTSTHLRPEVRIAAATALARIPGDDVTDVFEVLASDDVWEVRGIAVRVLTQRGRGQFVGTLLEELPSATGTRMKGIINLLSASGDARAAKVLLERFQKAPEGEGRPFVQALAQNGSEAAASALMDLFCGPERIVGRGGDGPLTTRNYLPLLLMNLRGPERVLLNRFVALPREQYELRSLLLPTITGIASDRNDQPELQEACIEPVRAILFDQEELPQLRVQALNVLARKWLSIDDVMRLKRQRMDEQPGLRALFADFLNEYF